MCFEIWQLIRRKVKCQKSQTAKFSWKIETPLRLSIFNLVSDISRESKLTNKAERVMQADSSQSGFFTQIMNCLSSKSQTTAMINDVLEGWPRWMRESGLLDCVCKYCKYWDQTETCQTGAPRQGQPDIYLANCCWRPSLSHTTILIIHNWANCAKLGKIVERSLLASVCYTLSWYWLGRVVQNPAESQFISLNLMHNVDPFGKNRNLHFLCSMLLAKNALPIQHSVF